jgi:hypothetical protein
VLQDLTNSNLLDAFKVSGEVRDVLREHCAHSKDPAHAERLSGIPNGQQVFANQISS